MIRDGNDRLQATGDVTVCLPTWRNFNIAAFQCGLYEAQDVLVETRSAELVAPLARPGLRFRETVQRLLLYRDPTNRLMFVNPGLHPVQLQRSYPLLICVCQSYHDLLYINAIHDWRKRAETTLCWIDELWAASVHRYRNWLKAIDRFDHICVGSLGTVEALSRLLGRTCHWVPAGVDTLRFSPYPDPPLRSIDVYSVGRRWEGMHREFLKLAAQKQIFYVHDTFQELSTMKPYDHREHRDLYANVAKRSRCYVVAPAKMNLPSHTEGQVDIGYRYFEGAAAGSIMIGQAPTSEGYRRLFDWSQATVEVQPDGTDTVSTLRKFREDPTLSDRIHRTNAAQSLRRHDWIYRWSEIFRIAGVPPTPGMRAREQRLEALAAAIPS